MMLLKGCFSIIKCFFSPDLPAASSELFVPTPLMGFSTDRPPAETRSAASQASHIWKAKL